MARVILQPIGTPLDRAIDRRSREESRLAMQRHAARYRAMREEVRAGWGAEYAERVHRKGKLTAWERIERLADPGSAVLPFGTLVNYGLEFGEERRRSPGAGVVTAFLQVAGRQAVVIANDNTVASGSWWPQTPEKIQRAQEAALRLRLPVIYLIDSSGLFLPEQSRSFPGPTGAGRIFKMNSLLSDRQVPQLAGVFGDCIAGGGYMPIISDRVYMTEQAYMVIAGAALVKGGKGESVTSLSIGGPDVHVHLSGCADERVPDDGSLLARLRGEMEKLPSGAQGYYAYGREPAPPLYDPGELDELLPADHRLPYDARQVIARLVDDSLFWEALPERGREIVCGVGRIGGLYAGIVANNQEPGTADGARRSADRAAPGAGRARPGGILYREGTAKMSAFARACDHDGLPLVWLQDVSGFDIGPEAEREGLLGYGSSLLYTLSTLSTPVFTVLLRKASGAGYYAMNGRPFDPVLQLATPLARLAVMEGRTLAVAAFRTKLDENFRIAAASPEEREAVRRGMEAVEQRIESEMDPLLAARHLVTDEVVLPGELRAWLEALIGMSYQSTGYRRVKNPRIWSLHDLERLLE